VRFNQLQTIKGLLMPKMTKNQLIDAVSESSAVSKNDVKAVMEHLAILSHHALHLVDHTASNAVLVDDDVRIYAMHDHCGSEI
jgi:hypothetical protein